MLLQHKTLSICIWLLLFSAGVFAQQTPYLAEDRVAADFKKLLNRPRVAARPSFQITKTDSVIIETGYIYSEKDEKVPILIYKPVTQAKAFPAVIFLHGTGGTKDAKDIKNILYQLSKRGIMGVAIDARHHGTRIAGGAHGSKEYVEAITKAWHNTDPTSQTHPFFFDTAYDLWRVTDYLVSRPDVEAGRIGMGGISMGGIETWMAASVDTRIKVVVLDIAAQSFKWSLDNDKWQGRAGTIQAAHLQAAKDMGDSTLNKKNVKALWDKLLPGITGEFDCPSMIRLIAPRPLLVLNTERDQNCPLPGAKIAFESARASYISKNAADKIKMDIAPNLPHTTTPEHLKMTLDWFSKWL
ncbi:alpha/beta hydrolase family protein [Mucilaginibacter aquaedulcis]|uniref:alpha/beta hydrolase family protein n=1 Tax=Mucilaginibacter aquaedulcis TaxID=1187081 RepID=UPI0025B3D405|nr:alpha/beta hydrolase [Mucilaginibacter aquaedulcis]MDN3550796.1 alpha/beta hydrolase [Mucilaginibacter aquaedulcis]